MGGMNMNMSMGSGHGSVGAGGMSMGGSHGATNILPTWLAVIWTLAFLAVFLIHLRHLFETGGQRRLWHSGHVLMAIGMAFMSAPASIDHLNIPSSFWQIVFGAATVAVTAWIVTEVLERKTLNALWVVMATDLAAMIYMWSPNGFKAPVTWLLVAYFIVQSLLWGTDRMRSIDRFTLRAGFTVMADGSVGAAAAAPLICYRDLRVSMSAMTLGMVYMLVAMQLLM
ncbi:MAG TPA: DUF5134 domain-containing protein [Solirubrobacteraceae bacterium]|jgi:hypothetical protein|nr:DUF5134 domain-containing protein [Solirubrobacteraceae bacterium]